MAASPLSDALKKWVQRTAEAKSAGISADVISPLLKYDLQKVVGGGAEISDQEANLAILSAASGHPIISPPKKKTGLFDVLGNVPSDIEGIVKGFIPGMANVVASIPHELSNIHFTTDVHSPGEAFRNLASNKLTALLPGVVAGAQVTTPKGREEMRQHPVGTLLDVLPLASAGGRLATAGKVAQAAEELAPGAELTSKTRVAPGSQAIPAGSATEALAQGRPLAAITRKIPAGAGETASSRLGQLAQAMNIDKTTRSVARARSISQRRMHNQATDIVASLGDRVGTWSEEQWGRFYDIATGVEEAKSGTRYNPLDPGIPADQHAALLEIRKISEEAKAERVKEGTLINVVIDGKSYGYPITSSVARRFQTITKLSHEITQAKAPEKVARLQASLVTKQKEFLKAIHRDPPAALHDFITERTRQKVEEAARKPVEAKARTPQEDQAIRTYYQADNLAAITRDIQQSTSWQDMARLVGTRNFYSIYKSTITEALDLAKNGFDPIYLHHVPLNRGESVLNPKPLQEHYVSPETIKSRSLNFGPHYHDAAIALTDAAMEQIRADGTREFVDSTMKPLSTPVAQLKADASKALSSQFEGRPEAFRAALQRELETKFRTYDPSGPFTWKSVNVARDTDLAVPEYVARGIDKMFSTDRKLAVTGVWDKTLKVYKFSVLTGPRHIVHVAIGGMTMMLLRDPMAITQIPRAIRMIRDGHIPPEIPQHLYDIPGEHLWDYAGGHTAGRILMAIPNAMKRFEEYSANLERAAAFLSAQKRGLDVEAAAIEAGKIFVNLDDMVPVERMISKNIAPFYAFTRHLFRYLLTYPVDHPVRAAVLSRFAEQEQQDWNSALPKTFQQLFMLGDGPNVTGVDFKAINPFRSFGNDFSIAGFTSALNPAAQTVLTMVGINPLTANADLYPDVSYDETTGSLKAKRPHSSDWPQVLLSEFVPPLEAIDHFVQFSDRMRNLKKNNPEAFRRQLFSSLNIPFDVANIDIPLVKEKTELARYQAAQRAVSQGTSTGDFSEAQRYNVVPFRGQLTPPSQVADFWDQITKAINQPGISTKAVLPTYRGKRKKK